MNKKKFIGFAIAGAAALSLPLIAVADNHGAKHEGKRGQKHAERLAELDTNGDGNISKEEVTAHKAAMFAAIDANGDGAVTPDEMDAHHEAKRAMKAAERKAKRFAKMDADGNGTISAEEFATARPNKGFERMDADGDGVVTPEEMEAAKSKMKDRRGHKKERRGE